MITFDIKSSWQEFLLFIKKKISNSAYENWFSSIKIHEFSSLEELVLEVPNMFVEDYLLANHLQDLLLFLPAKGDGKPSIRFIVAKKEKPKESEKIPISHPEKIQSETNEGFQVKLNDYYRFETFIEGPSNQFVKSAALGIANKPGQSYNPLFIHGGVGLGKTHILHSIGHYVLQHHRKLRVQCITTEAFINDLVDSLRKKSIEKMKRFYRSEVDVLLVDDIQFLQNRLNFEEEFCNMFETFFNHHKQIVITSDKPPSQLRLSERMIARMEWGLVAQMGMPDLETRVAILQHKAECKGLEIPHSVAFFIAEHIHHNVRQLEGALNRLTAHCRLLNVAITEDVVEQTLKEMLHYSPKQKISVEQILKAVSSVFQVRLTDIKGKSRTKDIALSRQVAMFLAKEMIKDSLVAIGAYFGKKHSTILHACKNIEHKMESDEMLCRQIDMIRRSISA
ncbi:MAG: chromosomal replication initiator protein DnaA [Chlamydiales bacterium]